MSSYCTVEDVRKILPQNIVIGKNVIKDNAQITEERVQYMIEEMASQIDSYLTALYRIPLIPFKISDISADPIVFVSKYPDPIPLVNARLTSANIYDTIFMSQQEPNQSEWGKNNRALAFDDLKMIQSGTIQLKGQEYVNMRFVRMSLLDPPRIPTKDSIQIPQREAGK